MPPADKDLYIKRFSELKRGAPLYLPCEVQVGDVGFIDPQEGRLLKLYNIANPPTNGKPGCPSLIKLETANHTEEWNAVHMKNSKGLGASSQVTIPKDQIMVVVEHLKKTDGLPKYMNDHLSWIGNTYAGSYFFSPQSIILIVRTVKTDRWAIAVNTSHKTAKNLSFTIGPGIGATLWGQWSASRVISRRGPFPVTGALSANQTIFVQRIGIRPPIGYFGKPYFDISRDRTPTIERFRATVSSIKQDWWVVEEPEDTRSLPAVASGVSESTDF